MESSASLPPIDPVFSGLEPAIVWRHFAALCALPRPSKAEHAVVRHLLRWAERRKLTARSDSARNLIIEKPASPGYEHAPKVILQAHLDMVCQKEEGFPHDFARDPIRPEIENGWLLARHTTLGADNGIGVALALAALEDAALTHGALTALFTADEEAGMSGARALASDTLSADILLNLDTEEWGAFYLGCAGGAEIHADFPLPALPCPEETCAVEISLRGLTGGHSGIDIHRPRAHAIRVLLECLLELAQDIAPFALLSFSGGSVSNALPRAAAAKIALSETRRAALTTRLSEQEKKLRERFPEDSKLRLSCAPQPGTEHFRAASLPASVWRPLADTLLRLPFGVLAASADFPGVVETSCNFAPCQIMPAPENGTHIMRCRAAFLPRSLHDERRDALVKSIREQIVQAGGAAIVKDAYPGWRPDPNSRLLALCERVYQDVFSAPPRREVIHAGLECGLFARAFPSLALLSFGPDIMGAHAPGERVRVASVEMCWRFLRALLARLAA
ncbi:MAG: beta-Ala-His dipeptidase [Zoogloeaceae bacterium]|jgi:dipeptidase D|nr:beta-Ala-His dipeptidase [Zoogloeaceae bacterium]